MNMTTALLSAALGLGLAFSAMTASADTLLIDRAQAEYGHPQNGMTMGEVAARYGEPDTKHAPVGGSKPQWPPITRWVYAPFSVYFENDKVIDAVINREYAMQQGVKSE